MVEPFFLETGSRRLFAVYHGVAPGRDVVGHVLCAPPFNEEANRCRSMMTLQARSFAERGFATLVIDLYGTGDSGGEYRDARWELWLEDVSAGAAWLRERQDVPTFFWGIRLGAMVVADASRKLGPDGVIYWQPVLEGKQYLTQFLRIRIAANMRRPNAPKETTATLRETFASGGTVEVAGYEVHPELAKAIDGTSLAALPPPSGVPVLWLERALGERTSVGDPSRKVIDAWSERASVETRLFQGPDFWQQHERKLAPEIIDETSRWIDSVAGR